MNGIGEVVGGVDEHGGRPERRGGWFAGFLVGVGVGTGVAMCLWALSRSARHMELAVRMGADGSLELVVKWWAPTG
jgi:hypothetical protein